jgi:hypothetical protein
MRPGPQHPAIAPALEDAFLALTGEASG